MRQLEFPDHPFVFIFMHQKQEMLAAGSEVSFSCIYLCPCSVSLMNTSSGQMVAIAGGLSPGFQQRQQITVSMVYFTVNIKREIKEVKK